MSLIITIHIGEGIVMASDSRTTFNSQDFTPLPDGKGAIITNNQGIHYSDTTFKTFVTDNDIGISTCGVAAINQKPIAGFIENFINSKMNIDIDVEDVPALILQYFRNFVPIPDVVFHIAGYSRKEGILSQKLYRVFVSQNSIDEIDTTLQGAAWNGETEILSRIVNSLWVQLKTIDKDTGKEITQYNELKAPPIPWSFLSLQDSIDFATYAINTTIETMRFQQRLKTVGGPIDILIIKPNGHQWISHKKLHVQNINRR